MSSHSEKNPLLEAIAIGKRFSAPSERVLFSELFLKLYPGDMVSIGGRSGEGKSTLLHILGTLEPPTSGRLLYDGKPANQWGMSYLRNNFFGFVFQAFYLLEDFTLLENVLVPASIARISTGLHSSTRQRAYALLEKVGLEQYADRQVKSLSGGEKQRAALARALLNRPKVIFADEPTGNLDKENAQQVQQLLFEAVKEEQCALVIVTHEEELLQRCPLRYRLAQGALASV